MPRLLLIAALLLPMSSALADPLRWTPPTSEPGPAAPRKPAEARGNPCAAFGPGFVRMQGSDTCVKLGGGVSVEAGGRGR